MPCTWQLKMASPIPGELMVQIRHIITRKHHKQKEERVRWWGTPCTACHLLLFLSNTVRPLHPHMYFYKCPAGLLCCRHWVMTRPQQGRAHCPLLAKPNPQVWSWAALLRSCEAHEPPQPSVLPSTRSQWCTGTSCSRVATLQESNRGCCQTYHFQQGLAARGEMGAAFSPWRAWKKHGVRKDCWSRQELVLRSTALNSKEKPDLCRL